MAFSAVVKATSCIDTDVQTAVNAAAVGDTVMVPSGNCTWSTGVTISGKALSLVGAGIDVTNITDQGSQGSALRVVATAVNFVSVSGFTFIKSASHPSGIVQIAGQQADVAFRFHHNRILQASSGSRGVYVYYVFGLLDHVVFDATGTGSIQMVSVDGSSVSSDGGFTPWTQPLTLGTSAALYVEDCTFNYVDQAEDAVDAYTGARLVVRHNAFNNISLGFHGTDSGSNRSVFSYEIYSNTFTNNSSNTIRGATLRGGTGVIYNNTYTGTHGSWYGVALMVYRACPPMDQSAWKTCDGTNWEIGSTSFSAQASRIASTNGGVKFCSTKRDTVCTADSTCAAVGGGTCSSFFDGAGPGGYPCRDQVGRSHDQALAPVYVWSNGSVSATPYDGGNTCGLGINNYLQQGRDYINGQPMPGYSAYVYPHPLQQNGAPPAAPSDLSAASLE